MTLLSGGEPARPPDHALATVQAGGRTIGVVVAAGSRASEAASAARRIGTVASALEAADRRGRSELARSRETNLFYLLGEAIGSTLDLSRIADLLVIEARRIAKADAALIFLTDGDSGDLRRRSHDGDDALTDALATQLPGRLGLLEGTNWAGATLPGGPTPGIGPVLTVGVHSGAETLGLLAIARAQGGEPFTARDERVVGALTAGAGIVKARYHDRELRRQRLEQELALGRRIQLSLLPASLPAAPGWEIHVAYRAAREVGGDFYDAMATDVEDGEVGRLAFTVADVTGKGVPAALFMAHARAILRASAHHRSPLDALVEANRVIREDNRSGLLLTTLLARVETATGRVAIASAGHEPALRVTGDGTVEEVGGGGVLLGLSAAPTIGESDVALAPGDALILYTDGITDARDGSGEFFGDERLRAAVRANADAPAPAMVDAVLRSVDAFRGTAPAYDDLTLIVIRRQP